MEHSKKLGHAAAFLTIFIWGTTFASSKILLQVFTPFELLLVRFVIGFLALCLICPNRLKTTGLQQELMFALAGLCGITIHYLTENIAVQYSMASTVGVIKSVSPLLIAVLSYLVLKEGKLDFAFFAGFSIVMVGIVLVTLNGTAEFKMNPKGDLMALFSALMWAVYSLIIRKISSYGYRILQVTRKVFFYGILFMLPLAPVFGFQPERSSFANPVILLNLLFLGIGASAITFFSWNTAVKILGPVKTGIYLYATPMVTVLSSFLILREQISWMTCLGMGLMILGLSISEKMLFIKRGTEKKSVAPTQ